MLRQEHIERAAKNGISRKILHNRIFNHDWDMERATTQPVRHRVGSRFSPETVKKAAQNGISYQTMYHRIVDRGWTTHDACTKPAQKRRKGVRK